MSGGSWTHRASRVLVRPLIGTRVTPNHLTTARLLTGLVACACFALGTRSGEIWGGVLWVLSAFLDRADGELARIGGSSTRWGHLYDYYCDVAVNGLFFVAIGLGLRSGTLGTWAAILGVLAGATVTAAALWSESLEQEIASGEKAWSGRGGFDFDDVLYLFGPVAWLGWLQPLLIGAAVGGPVFAALTGWRLYRRRNLAAAPKVLNQP